MTERVQGLNHVVGEDQLVPGDHIYVHCQGGLCNKHGVLTDKGVVYYSSQTNGVLRATVTEFSQGNKVRLALYDQPQLARAFKRLGTTYTSESLPFQEVVGTALYYEQYPSKWCDKAARNQSQAFAYHCKTVRESSLKFTEATDYDSASRQYGTLQENTISPEDTESGAQVYAWRVDFEDDEEDWDTQS